VHACVLSQKYVDISLPRRKGLKGPLLIQLLLVDKLLPTFNGDIFVEWLNKLIVSLLPQTIWHSSADALRIL